MLIVSEQEELNEKENGYIFNCLLEKGYDENMIEFVIGNEGLLSQQAAQAYLNCFIAFGVEEAYRKFTEDDEVVKEISEDILKQYERTLDTLDEMGFAGETTNRKDLEILI